LRQFLCDQSANLSHNFYRLETRAIIVDHNEFIDLVCLARHQALVDVLKRAVLVVRQVALDVEHLELSLEGQARERVLLDDEDALVSIHGFRLRRILSAN